ncbi:MAG: hypothetical protein H3Z50_02750 [archaeon]|nr:hypothetical protein [archaeon]MCP8306003.1 hypothetical protein [archaeon]
MNVVRKGSRELSVGNLIGSNVTDILFSTGIGSIISGFILDRQKHSTFRYPISYLCYSNLFAPTEDKT